MHDAQQNYPDYTELACLERCEREHSYRYVQHLGSARPDASAHFGQMVHLAVKRVYEGKSVCDALLLAWPPHGGPVDPERKPHLTLGYAEQIAYTYQELYFPLVEWEL